MSHKYNSVSPSPVSRKPSYSFPKTSPGAAGLSGGHIISQMPVHIHQEQNCKNHAWIFSHGSFAGAIVLAIALVVSSSVSGADKGIDSCLYAMEEMCEGWVCVLSM